MLCALFWVIPGIWIPVLFPHRTLQLLELQEGTESYSKFTTGQWQLFGSQGSYWTNCCKLYCGCEWRKIVTVMIFVCWELRKGSVMSCALRRLRGIVSVNVLTWHQARRDCLWSCFRVGNWKRLVLILFPFQKEKCNVLQPSINNKTLPHCQ
jgi:hypothetical protein